MVQIAWHGKNFIRVHDKKNNPNLNGGKYNLWILKFLRKNICDYDKPPCYIETKLTKVTSV